MRKEKLIKERVNKIVDYLIKNECSTRQVAEAFNINRSTVNNDLQKHLNLLTDINKIEQVKKVLKNNKDNVKKGFNEYRIIDDYVIIYLKKRDGRIFETYIDLDDLEKLIELNWSWSAIWYKNIKGYYASHSEYLGIVDGKPKYKTWLLHKLIMNASNEKAVDHENHKTLDNRKKNLRVSPDDKNSKNRKSKNSNNTSGYRNVQWNKDRNRWEVKLQIDGKCKQLGSFKPDELDKAGKFAEEMREKYYGEYAGNN